MKKMVFLQARLTSSRLPHKCILPLAGKAVLLHAAEALTQLAVDGYALLTDAGSYDVLQKLFVNTEFTLFCGDSDNVLLRYCQAAEYYHADIVVRATGDNPLVSAALAQDTLILQEEENADYAAIIGTPLGTGVEVLRVSALQDSLIHTSSTYEQEHVGPALKLHADKYNVVIHNAPSGICRENIKVTLDTAEDYQYLQNIFDVLYHGSPIEIQELIAYADKT